MVTSVSDIQAVRAVAMNVAPEMIEPYIEDVEKQDILPIIGAALYFSVEANPEGEEYNTLLHGGVFTDATGETRYTRGLIIATAYLAYSRMLIFGDIQYTAFGTALKSSQYSTKPLEVDKIRAADSAKKLGFAILHDVSDYVGMTFNKKGCKPQRVSRPKFISIKKEKL